jgi:hypothetical protein
VSEGDRESSILIGLGTMGAVRYGEKVSILGSGVNNSVASFFGLHQAL